NTPVYVAGLDRGVRPIGDWSTRTSLSTLSSPVTRVCRPGTCRAPLSLFASTDARMSLTSVDLPEPETPVTDVSTPSGNDTSISRRLCSRAPTTVSWRRRATGRLLAGIAMLSLPDRYAPVIESVLATSWLYVPLCIMWPQCAPA